MEQINAEDLVIGSSFIYKSILYTVISELSNNHLRLRSHSSFSGKELTTNASLSTLQTLINSGEVHTIRLNSITIET